MTGWGKDSELSVRLMNKGCKKLQLKFNATCCCLHHKINNQENININTDILQQAIMKKIAIVKKVNNMKREVNNAIKVLKKGGIILYPTDTIWGIGCDALNNDAVIKVYEIKKE